MECEQHPVWLPSCTLDVLTSDDIVEWIEIGEVSCYHGNSYGEYYVVISQFLIAI